MKTYIKSIAALVYFVGLTTLASAQIGNPPNGTPIECCNLVRPESFTVTNVFTPNGDGVNDVFAPYYSGTENCVTNAPITSAFRLTVFDRSGRLVFVGEVGRGWDGKSGVSDASPGVYYYALESASFNEKSIHRTGVLTLLR